jgi:hypothetical protein
MHLADRSRATRARHARGETVPQSPSVLRPLHADTRSRAKKGVASVRRQDRPFVESYPRGGAAPPYQPSPENRARSRRSLFAGTAAGLRVGSPLPPPGRRAAPAFALPLPRVHLATVKREHPVSERTQSKQDRTQSRSAKTPPTQRYCGAQLPPDREPPRVRRSLSPRVPSGSNSIQERRSKARASRERARECGHGYGQ